MIKNKKGTILIEHRHGLGDQIALTIVLQHLREVYPDLKIDVLSPKGKHSIFHGLARKVLIENKDQITTPYDEVFKLDWWECDYVFPNVPSTKPSKCLKEIFNIEPTIKPYSLTITEESRKKASEYVSKLPDKPFVLIHYQGNSSASNKNLQHGSIKRVVSHLLANGYTPVILDWDKRSPIPDQKTVFCPGVSDPLWGGIGTGDGNVLAALIEKAALMVGIDSGPLHVAQATRTPTIGCWVKHHPIHFSDLSGDITHLVPNHHEVLIRGDKRVGLKFFESHYDYRTYGIIDDALIPLINEKLGIKEVVAESVNPYIDKSFLYDDLNAKGLNLAFSGQWQEQYGMWFVDGLNLKGKNVLDVGCGCGALGYGIQKQGAQVFGIDHNYRLIEIGKGLNFNLASLDCCDASNLHLFQSESIDCIHLCETLHEFREDQILTILKEFHRVLKRGGLIFSLLSGRNDYYLAEFNQLGFTDVHDQFFSSLKFHPSSMLHQYSWKFQIFRK